MEDYYKRKGIRKRGKTLQWKSMYVVKTNMTN